MRFHVPKTIKRTRKRGQSGFKGVYWLSGKKTWTVRIQLPNKRPKYGGIFKDATEAAKAFDRLAIFYYGDEAQLNFEGSREEYKKMEQEKLYGKKEDKGDKELPREGGEALSLPVGINGLKSFS